MQLYENMLGGMPIIILPPIKKQARTHKKKRINKKWLKRYGYIYYSNGIEDNQTFTFNGCLYMNRNSYLALKKVLEKEKNLEGQELRTV